MSIIKQRNIIKSKLNKIKLCLIIKYYSSLHFAFLSKEDNRTCDNVVKINDFSLFYKHMNNFNTCIFCFHCKNISFTLIPAHAHIITEIFNIHKNE